MINIFLKAKHWQLFFLTIGLPALVFIFMMVSIFTELTQEGVNTNQTDPAIIVDYFRFFPILTLILTLIIFGWFWAVGIGLQSKVPAEATMNTRRYGVFLLIPTAYYIYFSLFLLEMMAGAIEGEAAPEVDVFAFLVPFHFLSMICIFYCLYFAAKTIKTVELQRKVHFLESIGEFLLIWFYPLGIWIIQPRINKLVADKGQFEI